jgi:hypothetical protein
MSEFEIGDRVRVTNVDRWDRPIFEHYRPDLGDVGTVIRSPYASGSDYCVSIDGKQEPDNGWFFKEDWLELVDNPADDPVNHPQHYTSHPSGIECIEITQHMSFTLGNAVKYIWRADLKNDAIEDLKKAKWYIEREIAKREAA